MLGYQIGVAWRDGIPNGILGYGFGLEIYMVGKGEGRYRVTPRGGGCLSGSCTWFKEKTT